MQKEMRSYSSSLTLPLLLLAFADESSVRRRVHIALHVLKQSAAQGNMTRSPLQCESSSHCMSVATGRKLRENQIQGESRNKEWLAASGHLQQRQGDSPSGPTKSAAVATGGGGGGGGGAGRAAEVFVALEELERGDAVVEGGGGAAVVEGADVCAAGVAADD
jgi:hypothetical protein